MKGLSTFDVDALMKFDPGFGTRQPYPSHAAQYRAYHGNMAWLFNPWTGCRRHPLDVGSDPFGQLVSPGDAAVHDVQFINRTKTA